MRIFFDDAGYNMGTISVTRELPTEIRMTEAAGKATIFPVPTRDYLYINDDKLVNNYSIFSIQGQILKRGNIDESRSIDVKYLAKGSYLIRLEGGGILQTAKIIKL